MTNEILMNRRTFMRASAMSVAAVGFGAEKAFANFDGLVEGMMREARTASVNVVSLAPGFFVIENVGGNITVFSGRGGTLIVDSGISGQHAKIQEAIGGLGGGPLAEVINTHWHFDHTGGNEWMRQPGVRFTAHSNTRKHMSVATAVDPWHYTFPPTKEEGLPTNLLKASDTMSFQGQRLSIDHVQHAHTDGDLMVRFEEADVIATGDIFWNGYYPFIDCGSGGDIGGMIHGSKLALASCTANTKIVPGHGPIAGKSDLQTYHDVLHEIRGVVMGLKRKGMTQEEVVAEKPSAKFDAKWGNYAVAPDEFVKLVYKGVCCEED